MWDRNKWYLSLKLTLSVVSEQSWLFGLSHILLCLVQNPFKVHRYKILLFYIIYLSCLIHWYNTFIMHISTGIVPSLSLKTTVFTALLAAWPGHLASSGLLWSWSRQHTEHTWCKHYGNQMLTNTSICQASAWSINRHPNIIALYKIQVSHFTQHASHGTSFAQTNKFPVYIKFISPERIPDNQFTDRFFK